MATSQAVKNSINEPHQEAQVEDFIPYACHIDEDTIITKNGEFVEVIKIVGFNFESVTNSNNEVLGLREAVRKALAECIPDDHYAVWLHTVRRKKDISTGGDFEQGFAQELNRAWCDTHDWEHQHRNELYITVIAEGNQLSLADPKSFFQSLMVKRELRRRREEIDSAETKLTTIVDDMLDALSDYGAYRLSVKKNGDGHYYSEMAQFFSTIMNLEEGDFLMEQEDLAFSLPANNEVTFGFNVLRVSGEHRPRYGAMLTVKEYHELSTNHIDAFLQLPSEFIITETFDFVNSDYVYQHFKHQKDMFDASADTTLPKVTGIGDIMDSATGSVKDFGEHQLTIMLLSDSLKALEKDITDTIERFSSLGIIIIREDIFMEDCFWAQLPANFSFIKRSSPINTRRIGGYASLYNFPAGKLVNNHWGNAVTVFRTAANTPYFFNFHYGDNGHSLIVGPYGAGKTVLMNFLLAQAQKFKPRIRFFDQERGSEVFIRVLNGRYERLVRSAEGTSVRFNPFALEDTVENRNFLSKWLAYLMTQEPEKELQKDDFEKIRQAIDYAYSLPEGERRLGTVLAKFFPLPEGAAALSANAIRKHAEHEHDIHLQSRERLKAAQEGDAQAMVEPVEVKSQLDSEVDDLLAFGSDTKQEEVVIEEVEETPSRMELNVELGTLEERLSIWYGQGDYAHYFDNAHEQCAMDEHRIFGLDMTDVVEDHVALTPVMLYVLHRIFHSLDGTPSIIVLDEAWELIDSPAFAPFVKPWLDALRERNAMAIFATEHPEHLSESPLTKDLADGCATQIFLPNKEADENLMTLFDLSEEEFEQIRKMKRNRRQFLLRHHVDSIIGELDLSGHDYVLNVLSADGKSIAIMNGAIDEYGESPDQWLPYYKERSQL